MPVKAIFWYNMFSIVPLLSALDFILQPFSLSVTVEFENVIPETTLLLFPPTDPMLKPLQRSQSAFHISTWENWISYCPPEQVIPVTVMFVPLVTATQSSWFFTTVSDKMTLEQLEKSKPSELCAAALPSLAELEASPAELSSVRPVIIKPSAPVMSKQWTGQFWMFKLEICPFFKSLSTIKWSGLSQVSLAVLYGREETLLGDTSIRTLSIPIRSSIAIDDMALGAGKSDICSTNDNGVKVVI
jgi:hypothetical protein